MGYLKATKKFPGRGKGFHENKDIKKHNMLEYWEKKRKKEGQKPVRMKDIKKLEQKRTQKAISIDQGKQAKEVLKLGTRRANMYLKRPNRYDIEGIDTLKEKEEIRVDKDIIRTVGERVFVTSYPEHGGAPFTGEARVIGIGKGADTYMVQFDNGQTMVTTGKEMESSIKEQKPTRKTYDLVIDGDIMFNYETRSDAEYYAKEFRSRPEVKSVNIKETESENYRLGDKYRTDFDYKGMLQTGTKADQKWSRSDLEKLYGSLEDVNYHQILKHLGEALTSKTEKTKQKHLKKFRADCKKALTDIKKEEHDVLEGGQSDGITIDKSDPKEVKIGEHIESEHTNNPAARTEITSDHTEEDPHYNTNLTRLEKGVEISHEAKEKIDKKYAAIDKLKISDEKKIQLKIEEYNEYMVSEMKRAEKGEIIDLTNLQISKEKIDIAEITAKETEKKEDIIDSLNRKLNRAITEKQVQETRDMISEYYKQGKIDISNLSDFLTVAGQKEESLDETPKYYTKRSFKGGVVVMSPAGTRVPFDTRPEAERYIKKQRKYYKKQKLELEKGKKHNPGKEPIYLGKTTPDVRKKGLDTLTEVKGISDGINKKYDTGKIDYQKATGQFARLTNTVVKTAPGLEGKRRKAHKIARKEWDKLIVKEKAKKLGISIK